MFVVLFVIAPSSQELEPPANPARFSALAILRALQDLPSLSCNDSLIADFLGSLALSGTTPEIREAVNSLDRLGLVTIERTDPLLVFTLTQNGDDAAKGLIVVEGVLRPPPECPY